MILWNGFTGKLKTQLNTEHQGNIFSVKFLPETGDSLIVTGLDFVWVKVSGKIAPPPENLFSPSCRVCYLAYLRNWVKQMNFWI